MKRCPHCGRDYNDDSLSFCLDDGSELLFGPSDEPATATLHATDAHPEASTRPQLHSTDQAAVAHTEDSLTPVKASNSSLRFGLLIGLAVVVLAAIGLFGYRYLPSPSRQIDSIAVLP